MNGAKRGDSFIVYLLYIAARKPFRQPPATNQGIRYENITVEAFRSSNPIAFSSIIET